MVLHLLLICSMLWERRMICSSAWFMTLFEVSTNRLWRDPLPLNPGMPSFSIPARTGLPWRYIQYSGEDHIEMLLHTLTIIVINNGWEYKYWICFIAEPGHCLSVIQRKSLCSYMNLNPSASKRFSFRWGSINGKIGFACFSGYHFNAKKNLPDYDQAEKAIRLPPPRTYFLNMFHVLGSSVCSSKNYQVKLSRKDLLIFLLSVESVMNSLKPSVSGFRRHRLQSLCCRPEAKWLSCFILWTTRYW